MTSNAGAQRIMAPKNLGFITERSAKEDHERMKSHVMEEVKQIFKPEFINRVDGIMVFHTLEKPEQRKIVELLLKELSDRLSKNPGFTLEFSLKKDMIHSMEQARFVVLSRMNWKIFWQMNTSKATLKTMTEFFSILTMESQLLRKQKRRKSRKIQQTHSR